jgi:hypothetical protein
MTNFIAILVAARGLAPEGAFYTCSYDGIAGCYWGGEKNLAALVGEER